MDRELAFIVKTPDHPSNLIHSWMTEQFGDEHIDDVTYRQGNWSFRYDVIKNEYTWLLRHKTHAVMVWLRWA